MRKLVIEGGGEAFAKSAMAALGFFCSPTRENENFVSPKWADEREQTQENWKSVIRAWNIDVPIGFRRQKRRRLIIPSFPLFSFKFSVFRLVF